MEDNTTLFVCVMIYEEKKSNVFSGIVFTATRGWGEGEVGGGAEP